MIAADRFWAKVDKTSSCWRWIGAVKSNGYGNFWDGRYWNAHRWAYEALVGPIPAGLTIDHLCRNRQCVNPDHLEPVTMAVNLERGTSRAAVSAYHAARTHCKRGHAKTPENTYYHESGNQCQPCRILRGRLSRAA